MIDFKLTKVQIEYLLFLFENENLRTITSTSLYFNCSKANSKKILDRMVSLGVLYKIDNGYSLTKIGEALANNYYQRKKDILLILERIFHAKEKRVENFTLDIINKDIEGFYEAIRKKANIIRNIESLDNKISKDDFIKVFGRGKFGVNFCIYKIDDTSSFMKKSMANKGFESDSYITIDDEAYISLKTDMIERISKGFLKKGIAVKLFYHKNNKEYEIIAKDREFKIPLDIIDYWNNVNMQTLQAGLVFTIKAQIGMIHHVKKALFLFSVNIGLS